MRCTFGRDLVLCVWWTPRANLIRCSRCSRPSATPSLSASPSKDSMARVSPRPPPFTTVPLGAASGSQSGSWTGPS